MRKMLNVLQMSVKDGCIELDKTVLTSNNYIKEVLKELMGNKKWLTIRQIIADSNIKDFEELYRSLFDYSPKYAPGKEGSVAIILNEHLYQANFRIDKEINVMSAISQNHRGNMNSFFEIHSFVGISKFGCTFLDNRTYPLNDTHVYR
jgi:hypothetical protein